MHAPHPHDAHRHETAAPEAERPHDHAHHASDKGGHDAHAGHSIAMFRDRFWVSLLLTVPTLVFGHMLPEAFGYTPPAWPGARWYPALFGTMVFLYGGQPFLRGAVGELRLRRPGMMTLITLAIGVAFLWSIAVLLGAPGMPLWEELATLVTIMVLGHWIEMRSVSQALGALQALAKLLPNTTTRIAVDADGTAHEEEVTLEQLTDGDEILVRPGQSVAADGDVLRGESDIDEAALTGESRPVRKGPGDHVTAGTINSGGALHVRVTGTGDRTTLAGIMRLVADAQSSRSRAQALADRAAALLTYVALGAGVVTLTVWLLIGAEPAYAVQRLVTVLVIACPHALGLAVPLVVAISTTLGAQNGLLVRDRRGLEEARNVTTVVFDKTGTLTLGEHRVVAVQGLDGVSDTEALRLAAAVERDAEHSVARAIVTTAAERGLRVPTASAFKAEPGIGVSATVEGRRLAVGGPNLLAARQATMPTPLDAFVREAAQRGEGVVLLVEGAQVLAAFVVADAVRPEAPEAVRKLQAMGVEVVMLTGDAEPVAKTVAAALGIAEVLAQVLPADKAGHIERLQQEGRKVAMVGDGVNDAPALVTANVGVAIGAGTDVAVEAGDIVLVRNDPRDVARIIGLSRASYRKMVQNLWWAAGYNILAIPAAAGVFAPWGFVMTPAMGAILMSASTVVVAVNAQLLRRVEL